jgi:hypothetical protein
LNSEPRFAVAIPFEYSLGVNCAVGAQLQIPVSVSGDGLGPCTVELSADGGSVALTAANSRISETAEGRIIVLDVVAEKAASKDWVTITVKCGEKAQLLGFFVHVSERPT